MKNPVKTKPLQKAKTAEEILKDLGLEPTLDHLKIAQAAIDDGAAIRAEIKERVQFTVNRMQGFVATIQKMGVKDIGDLIKQFANTKGELKKSSERTATTEQALLDAQKMLAPKDRAAFNKKHRLALRRANDAFPMAKYDRPGL